MSGQQSPPTNLNVEQQSPPTDPNIEQLDEENQQNELPPPPPPPFPYEILRNLIPMCVRVNEARIELRSAEQVLELRRKIFTSIDNELTDEIDELQDSAGFYRMVRVYNVEEFRVANQHLPPEVPFVLSDDFPDHSKATVKDILAENSSGRWVLHL